MPIIHKKQISQNISIAVWKIDETEEFFYNSLKLFPDDELHIKNIKLQKVRLQKLACRAALAELLGLNNIEITYSNTGQPQLKDYHISFSHTSTSVAVSLSSFPVGIDIEELKPRILPLYSRFMSKKEILSCDVNNLQELYYFWCAKEAMYKWFAKGNIDFIEDLFVMRDENKGVICEKSIVQLMNFRFDDLVMVICF